MEEEDFYCLDEEEEEEMIKEEMPTDNGLNLMMMSSQQKRKKKKKKTITEFKSKNLVTERKRRQKLKDKLMALRALVPNITNMTKEKIISDAITYIEELQKEVKGLEDHLIEIEDHLIEIDASLSEELQGENPRTSPHNSNLNQEKCSIEVEVKVIQTDWNKMWINVFCENRRGLFTKLVEVMGYIGLEVSDTNVISFRGAFLAMFSVEGSNNFEMVAVEQVRKFLLETIHQ